jgi:hypothetical protein
VRRGGGGRRVAEEEARDDAEVAATTALMRPQEQPLVGVAVALDSDDLRPPVTVDVDDFDGIEVIDRQPVQT